MWKWMRHGADEQSHWPLDAYLCRWSIAVLLSTGVEPGRTDILGLSLTSVFCMVIGAIVAWRVFNMTSREDDK